VSVSYFLGFQGSLRKHFSRSLTCVSVTTLVTREVCVAVKNPVAVEVMVKKLIFGVIVVRMCKEQWFISSSPIRAADTAASEKFQLSLSPYRPQGYISLPRRHASGVHVGVGPGVA
jgi:hypothetical protein